MSQGQAMGNKANCKDDAECFELSVSCVVYVFDNKCVGVQTRVVAVNVDLLQICYHPTQPMFSNSI